MTACRLTLRKYSRHRPIRVLGPHYGTVCLRLSEIHTLLSHLSGIIICCLLEMLHISGIAISVIVCNCMSFCD